jgi:hypothetical protein
MTESRVNARLFPPSTVKPQGDMAALQRLTGAGQAVETTLEVNVPWKVKDPSGGTTGRV